MDKRITLQITDSEYKRLMELYHLGHLIEDSVTEKSQQTIIQEIEFEQKMCKQAHQSGSKNVFTEQGYYSITREIEDWMLEIFEDFKEFIKSGEDARQDEIIHQQIKAMKMQEKKKKK